MRIPALLAETIQTLTDRARASMGEQRFLHLLGVTHTVMVLAEIHRLGIERAALSGLLHDISKPMEPRDLKRELKSWGEPVPEEDRDFPRTWHGLHAAGWARRELKVEDEEILEAIAFHTTADAGLRPLGQALFVADFTEPLRRIDEAPAVLAEAKRDLLEGFRTALRVKVGHVAAKGKPVHPRARRALLDFLPGEEAETLLEAAG